MVGNKGLTELWERMDKQKDINGLIQSDKIVNRL